MRFAKIAAACVLLLLLLTPAKEALRALAGSHALQYLVVLTLGYGILLAAFWAARWALVFSESWDSFGLEDLDHGVAGAWATRWGVGLSVALVVTAFLGIFLGVQEGLLLTMIESCVVGVAIVLAMFGKYLPRKIEDTYDPLPPLPLPTPRPKPDDEEEDQDTSPSEQGEMRELVMPWYFRPEPGDVSSVVQSFMVKVNASMSRYEEMLKDNHIPTCNQDYARFVTEGRTQEVISAAGQLREISKKYELSAIAEINNVLAFAQRFAYVSDQDSRGMAEYPKFPLETFVDDHGDCEDHANVAAACLLELGYDVRLVSVEYKGESSGHMALAVGGGGECAKCLYADRTGYQEEILLL